MNIDLHDKVALVTGAGSGIGRAIAVELARSGAYVTVNYRNNKSGAQETLALIKEAGGDGQIAAGDVSKADDVERLIQTAAQSQNRLDILINNAGGIVQRCKIQDMSESLWDEVMNINAKSTFLCCRAVISFMKGHSWGRIINMSSLAAHDGGGNGAIAYAASKAAIQTFTKGLAKELAAEGITVNCVAPGLIATAFHDVHTAPEARRTIVQGIPLAREGQAVNVTGAVLFLVSDLSAFITGETININGGARMC